MKVLILDANALRAVSPAALSAYIRAEGWEHTEAYGDTSDVYTRHDAPELVLPRTSEIADYPAVVSNILRRLAVVEDRTELQIYRDLSVADCDVVRSRAPFSEKDGSVLVADGVALFVNSKELLLSAACAAKEPKAQYRAGGIRDASDYMNRVRLGQTEQGSFIVTLLTPVPVNLEPPKQGSLWPTMASEPYERQVTRTLIDSLAAAKRAAEGAVKGSGLDSFRSAIKFGVSVNSCVALAALTESGQGLDVSVTWARTRPAPEPRSKVRFSTEEGEIFREAARYLREVEPRPDEHINAFVVSLDRGPEQDEGRVTLKTFLDGKPVSIFTTLGPQEYAVASTANNDKLSVTVRGDLVRRGNRWHLERPRDLRTIEEEIYEK